MEPDEAFEKRYLSMDPGEPYGILRRYREALERLASPEAFVPVDYSRDWDDREAEARREFARRIADEEETSRPGDRLPMEELIAGIVEEIEERKHGT